jgi:hypothetical protein
MMSADPGGHVVRGNAASRAPVRAEDSAERAELGVVPRENDEGLVFDFSGRDDIQHIRTRGFHVEHPHDMTKQRSAADKGIVGVACVDLIGQHMKPQPRV